MPYLLNAIPLGASVPKHCTSGSLIAELDDPASAMLKIADSTFSGIRYLIVCDDGSGYTSSMPFVHIPSSADDPATLRVPDELMKSFENVLSCLLSLSPLRCVILYLEANRIVSRPDPTEEYPPTVVLNQTRGLAEILAIVKARRFAEEIVYVVQEKTK
jgi:hypothetical protein